jgi:hypothetical protein
MSFQTGSIDKNGLARTEDGKLYVTSVGTASITGGNTWFVPSGGVGGSVSGAADTNENTLATIAIPALSATSIIRVWMAWSFTNSANAKTMRVRFSGAAGTVYMNAAITTQNMYRALVTIRNDGATGSQVGSHASVAEASGGLGQLGSGALQTSSVDTSVATTIVITGQKALGSETLTLSTFLVEVLKP